MMKNKGFTLIELLAVIVILAIIALIATPIIMTTIESAQKSASERSVENYIDAIRYGIMDAKLNNKPLKDGTYNILKDGSLCFKETCDEEEKIKVDVTGQHPESGTIVIDNGQVKLSGVSINMGKYNIMYDSNNNIVSSEINLTSKLCTAIAPIAQTIPGNTGPDSMEITVVGVQATEEKPYARGAVYSCDLGDGPRIFYVLEATTTEVKFIMNENLGDSVLWASSGDNSLGPVTANAALVERTSGWTKLSEVGGIVELPSDILGSEKWLVTNLQHSGNEYPTGYWTSTPYEGYENHFAYIYYSSGTTAGCGVDGDGDLDSTAACGGSGIRPVITIPINEL